MPKFEILIEVKVCNMMIKCIFISMSYAISLTILNAQEEAVIKIDSQQTSKSDIYVNVEQKPEFPGGKEGLIEFYKKTSLSSICDKKEDNCKTLYYQVVIDTFGNVRNFKIIKGINTELNAETEQIVNQMPRWKPGMEKGRLVKVLVTLDIKYKLIE